MRRRLPIAGGSLEIVVPEDRLVAANRACGDRAETIELRPALAATLAEPVGYPPLAQTILPGDRVTIAVDPELPQAEVVIGELVRSILEAGHEPGDITVLHAESAVNLSVGLPEGIHFVLHDPEDEATHAYLAATREGHPVYLNRAIGDADVMIPLGVQRLPDELDARGVHGGWFPAFSNLEMQQRFQSAGNVEWKAHQRRRYEETEEAAWLLGTRLVVQVLPGPQGTIAGVWCGDADEVSRVATQACQELWSYEISQPADLVVATLDNAPAAQSWRQVARALEIAARGVAEGGTIVLWTELAVDPGPALRSLARFEESDDEQRLALLKYRGADAVTAKVVGDCLRNCRVYLHSRLEDSLVEEIGLASLHDPAELQRLVDAAPTCLLFGSAQHAGLHVKQGVETEA